MKISFIVSAVVIILAYLLYPTGFEDAYSIIAILLVALILGWQAYLPFKRLVYRKAVIFDVGGVLLSGDYFTEELNEMPGMKELIGRLHKKYITAIYSNNNVLVSIGFNKKFSYMRSIFDYELYSSLVRGKKPDPKGFQTVLQKIGVKASNAVFVDDTLENVQSANRIGMHGIHFKSAAHLETELKKLGYEF